jgi:polyketide biosynthesis enoyl-CoA hydratase PksI
MNAVVHITRTAQRVAVIEMADREHSNQFTRALVTGLLEAIHSVQNDPSVHVVVVHGYDSVFCTGGTREELLGVFEGTIRFDDVPLYRMFLDCQIPVIAAMQGHALGGGLITGLFGDVVLLAEEQIYSANFMKYGFTPGMGATLVLPEKFGHALATEMMLTARNYHGGELQKRGLGSLVVKRAEVIPTALQLARQMADKPRLSLTLLKRHLTRRLRSELPETVRAEIEMHQAAFTQPELRERIQTLFGA